MIRLGDKVRDRVTKAEGIAVACTQWLFGCTRISFQPETNKDGKVPDLICSDEEQLELVQAGVVVPSIVEMLGPPREISVALNSEAPALAPGGGDRDDQVATSRD